MSNTRAEKKAVRNSISHTEKQKRKKEQKDRDQYTRQEREERENERESWTLARPHLGHPSVTTCVT